MEAMSIKLIRHLEELAANAWPAAVVQVVDGWRLRFNGQVTRRANSVWPNEAGNYHALAERLALVEDFYARRNSPARYQICPAAQPANLDGLLEKRGYIRDAPTAVQIAPLALILPGVETNPAYSVTVAETFDEPWFAAYCQAEQVKPQVAEARRAILQRIGPRTGYALLQLDGEPVALGLGVVERGWVGLFSVATRFEFRRQGAATAVLQALAQWGQRHQANRMYLQVMANNVPALTLYARLGFETLYHYHYRELRNGN